MFYKYFTNYYALLINVVTLPLKQPAVPIPMKPTVLGQLFQLLLLFLQSQLLLLNQLFLLVNKIEMFSNSIYLIIILYY